MKFWKHEAIGRGLWLCALAAATPACTNDEDAPGADSDFVVDNPMGNGEGTGLSSTGTAGADESGGDDPSGGEGDGGDDGAREVSEADIVFVENDRLYALSASGGLSVIDAANPDQALPVLGRYRMPGQPFEMYLDGGQVFVMMNDYGSYTWDDDAGAYSWHSASRLVALDASNPASIVSRGEFEISGTIQDSRRVGDVLYVVTFEDGWCWGCNENQPRTVVTSLDVSNPAAVQVIDTLEFANNTGDPWDWAGPRSVSSTDERLYIGGIEYDGWEDAHSVIDVIDISDAGGTMIRGASVQVAGSIQSRWQMDEHEGALRVISQPWGWNTNTPPVIETFAVTSASEITELASLTMILPRPESLQSVRFDGPRAYAITFEQTDPLFTIDLADPANPVQAGELEIPGWVHHMEPRGDRLLALGFDQDDPEGAINVSLFDVSDFANPALLSRVGFGGDWAYFAEDQNRIHKAFSILDELGLVLVPFSGWNYEDVESEWSCGSYTSGIQLVDWANDSLALRGVAPSHGQARRALIHRDRLLAMSDKSVQSFDIGDRDAPAARADVALAANVSDVAFGDGIVVRLATDWWTNEVALEVVSEADPETAEPLGRLALATLSEDFACGYSWGRDLFVHEGIAYLLRETYDWSAEDYSARLVLDAIDVTNPAAPQWTATVELPFSMSYGGYGLGLQNQERSAMLVGDALVFTTADSRWEGEEYIGQRAGIEIVDLSVPGAPVHSATLQRPDGIAHGSLQQQGDELFSWHMRAVAGDDTKVRFFFDRFDVSSPDAPEATAAVNVPGQVVAYDDEGDRVVTVGFNLETIAEPEHGCWSHPKAYGYDYDEDSCTIAHRPLHLLALDENGASLLDTLDVEGDAARLTAVMGTGSRLFAMVTESGSYGYWGEGDSEPTDYVPPTDSLAVITGHDGDALDEASRVVLDHSGWTQLIGVAGDRAMYRTDAGLGFVDASEPTNPIAMIAATFGWGCYDAVVTEDAVFCPLGEYGLQVIAMP